MHIPTAKNFMATKTSGTTTTAQSSVTVEAIGRIADASEEIIGRLQSSVYDDERRAEAVRKGYTITEVARMLNRTADGIRKAEKQGKLDPPPMKENGRRSPYSLAQINAMREYWDCRPGRAEGCLLYTSPSPRDRQKSRMPSSA